MNWHDLRVYLCVMTLMGSLALSPARAASEPTQRLTDLAASVLPTVVAIQCIGTTPQGQTYYAGSGFIIDSSGVILTNRHVIAGTYEITAMVPGVGKLKARPLFISDGIDVALLKVDAGQKLPAVKLGDSDGVRIGDPVFLVGNPLGIGESLSVGVVSALNRDIGETMYDHFIQTDAALNHGNSGGAMFNAAGEVIGVNTGLTSSPGNTGSVGIGYAMPINDAKFITNQYLRTGTVVVGTLGVRAQRMTEDLAAAFGVETATGAIITHVAPDGPAAGKLREGDVVLQVGAQDATDTRAAARLIAATAPGQQLAIRLLRGGGEQFVTVTVGMSENDPAKVMAFLGRVPEQAALVATPSDPGMKLAAINETWRQTFGLDANQPGVVVTDVNPKSAAADRKIAAGDVILSVDGVSVNSVPEFRAALQAASDRHMRFAALLVAGERGPHWVSLPLEPDHLR
jgi:serine protease Do